MAPLKEFLDTTLLRAGENPRVWVMSHPSETFRKLESSTSMHTRNTSVVISYGEVMLTIWLLLLILIQISTLLITNIEIKGMQFVMCI